MAAIKGNGANNTQAKKMSKIEQENQRLIELENQRHDEEIRKIKARNDKKKSTRKKSKERSRSQPTTQSQRITRSKGMSEAETSDDHQSEDEEAKTSQNVKEDPNASQNSDATLVEKSTNNNTINDEDPNPDFSEQRKTAKENADEMIDVITKLKDLANGESKEEDFKGKLIQIVEMMSQSFVKLNSSYSIFIGKMEKQCKTGMINRLAYENEYPSMMKKSIDNKIKKMLSGPELNKKKATENLIARREIDEDAHTHRQVTLTGVQEDNTEKIAPDQYKKNEAEKAQNVIVEICDKAEEYWKTPEWHKLKHIREARVFRPVDYEINDIVIQTNRMNPDKPGRHGLNQGTERTYKRRTTRPDGTEEWVDFEEKRYQKLVATLRTNEWADYVNACQLCVIMVANKIQSKTGLVEDFRKRRIHPKYSIRAQHAADKLYKAAQEDERRRVRLRMDNEAKLKADEISQDEYDQFMKEPEDSPDWLKRVMCEKSKDGLWWPKLVLCKFKDGKSKRYIRDQEEMKYKKVLEKRSLAPGAMDDLIDGQQY